MASLPKELIETIYIDGYNRAIKEIGAIDECSKELAEILGAETNRLQTIEECGELIKAISKLNRTLGIGQKTEITYEEALQNLIEEIADVEICLEQMKYLNNLYEKVNDAKLRAYGKVKCRYQEVGEND